MDFEAILFNITHKNSFEEYLTAIWIFFVSFVLLAFLRWFLEKKIEVATRANKIQIDDVAVDIIKSFSWPASLVLAFNLGVSVLDLDSELSDIIYKITLVILAFYVVRAIQHGIEFFARSIKNNIKSKQADADTSGVEIVAKLMHLFIWVFAVIVILENFGFDLSTLVAGVGVGSIAIAFALQNILEDLFASLSIYFDRPFNAGDFIIVGDNMGTVKSVGIKTSRVKTLDGEELIISNKELTQTRIRNFKRMERRRRVFKLNVVYGTPVSTLKKIPDMLTKIIEPIELVEIGRIHFETITENSYVFEIEYYIDSPDYKLFMDIQQRMNLEILEVFEKEKIQLAHPTQTIIIQK